MEKVAHKFSEKISTYLNYNEDKKAVIAYGLIAIFEIFTIAAIIILIGTICNFLIESLVIFLGVGILKKSTGGAHSRTLFGCIFISVSSISFLAILSRYVFYFNINIYINIAITIITHFVCLYLFYKYVPVDSINKPITNPIKIKKLRIQSYILIHFLTSLSIVLLFFALSNLRYNSIIFSIRSVIIWQSLMLTRSGAKYIEFLDLKLLKGGVEI